MPEILVQLGVRSRLVVTAPPGAGKTTRIPLALLDQPWMHARKLILVEPRRIAARAAAERMAKTLDEQVGETVGLRSRLDTRVSAVTRIEVVTEGVFTRMILSDPGLEGVAAVLFDEFHERSLDADEGLAFALDAQSILRPDLRIIIMSATLPPNLTSSFFDALVVTSDGRAHEVETVYLGAAPRGRIEDHVAGAIRKALAEQTGSILAFLPGAGEIERTADRLQPLPARTEIARLYGALGPAEQNAAIAPPEAGVRRIVLATDIAESALTIAGVRVVVDGGLARIPRFDVGTGSSRLETVRVSVASADQRRGRAGRTGPGVCYRLWREAEMRAFAAAPSPEIENADLTGLNVDLARWGAKSPADLNWLTPPRETPWRMARDSLVRAGALDDQGALTVWGKRISDLALPPRLALMVVQAAENGQARLGAALAAVLSERDLGGRSTDIDDRLVRASSETSPRARAMRRLVDRWTRDAGERAGSADASAGAVLAAAFPERIALARPGHPGRFLLAGGRGAWLDETDPLARERWIVAAELTGAGPDLRITLAARITESDAVAHGGVKTVEEARYDAGTGGVRARRTRRMGAILLEDTPLAAPPPELIRACLLEAVRKEGLSLLPGAGELNDLLARVNFLARALGPPWPTDFAARLAERLDLWFAPLLEHVLSLDAIGARALADAGKGFLERSLLKDLDRLAPDSWTTPAGRRVVIDYAAEGGPLAQCRVQEAFGLSSHPVLAGGRVPLSLSLLSPAGAPVAITRDLPGFWSGGYADMRKDMRGRYPKHDWPDKPSEAVPTSRARRQAPESGR